MSENHDQEDFSYVDQMLYEKNAKDIKGRIKPCDFSELHSYVKYYRTVYWEYDTERNTVLLQLIKEIEYLYCKLYPEEPRIEENRNVRNAGRPKKYDSEFNEDIMALYRSGFTVTETARKKGCSKAYVSKLIHKQRHSGTR